ncbi:MAG: TfoX/Sxy family protein [Pyrinomonadaceae bacterium]
MSFNEKQATRIRNYFEKQGVEFTEKRMFGGLCFLVDEKMCCGTHTDKATGDDLLLCRIGEEAYGAALEKQGCIPMEFTGRAMKGFVFVESQAIVDSRELGKWLKLCLDFNPLAKKSKKRS